MAKDEQFLVFFLIITLLDFASSLYLSQEAMTKDIDESFLVICKDEAGQSVTWKGPRGTLSGKTRPQVQHGSYGTAIFFSKTKMSDTGNYTCILNSLPQVRRIFSLKVQEVLEFRNTPENQTAIEGKSFTLLCNTNLDNTQITWSLASGLSILDEKRYQIMPQGLHIKNVTREDAQVYQCQAFRQKMAIYKSRNIVLDVHHPPSLPYKVFAEEEEVYGFLNEAVNLTCEVEANPPPKFEWKHKNMGDILNISSHISVLQLNVTEETLGTYQCTAFNGVGKLEKYFDVQLGEHPDMPTNIELLEATADSLEIKVEVPNIPDEVKDSVMDPQFIVVEYKPVSESEWYSMVFNITSDTIVLPGLSKKTKYEIQAATKNIAGLSEYYFNQTIFETSPAISVHTKSPIVIYSSVILISMFWIA